MRQWVGCRDISFVFPPILPHFSANFTHFNAFLCPFSLFFPLYNHFLTTFHRLGRAGLGQADLVAWAAELKSAAFADRASADDTKAAALDYRDALGSRYAENAFAADARALRRVCEQLDRAAGIENEALWPRRAERAGREEEAKRRRVDEDEEENVQESVESVENATENVSKTTENVPENAPESVESVSEMTQNMQETTRDTSTNEGQSVETLPSTDAPSDDAEAEEPPLDMLPPRVQVLIVNDYLRRQHRYCLWCGLAYPSIDEMERACPGTTRDSH